MLELVQSLTLPFAAGFVVQRFLELVDSFIAVKIKDPNRKKTILGVASVLIGCLLAKVLDMQIFGELAKAMHQSFQHPYWDEVFSGLFISGGTEGFNSLLKFANYKKEESKANAASKKSRLSAEQLRLVNPQS